MDPKHFIENLLSAAKDRPDLSAEDSFEEAFKLVLLGQESRLKRMRQQYEHVLVEAIKLGRANGWPVKVAV
jgi:hypothetical protein